MPNFISTFKKSEEDISKVDSLGESIKTKSNDKKTKQKNTAMYFYFKYKYIVNFIFLVLLYYALIIPLS
jgi:hypothetical protein